MLFAALNFDSGGNLGYPCNPSEQNARSKPSSDNRDLSKRLQLAVSARKQPVENLRDYQLSCTDYSTLSSLRLIVEFSCSGINDYTYVWSLAKPQFKISLMNLSWSLIKTYCIAVAIAASIH